MTDQATEAQNDALALAGAMNESFKFDLLTSERDSDEVIFAKSSKDTARAMGLPYPLPFIAASQSGNAEHSYFMGLRALGVALDKRRQLAKRLMDVREIVKAKGLPSAPRPGERPSVERRVWVANHAKPSPQALTDASVALWSQEAGHDLSELVAVDKRGDLTIDYAGEAVQLERLLMDIDLDAGQWIANVKAYCDVCQALFMESIDPSHAHLIPHVFRSTLARSGSMDRAGLQQILREQVSQLESMGERSQHAAQCAERARSAFVQEDWAACADALDSFHGKASPDMIHELFSGKAANPPFAQYPLAPANSI